MSDPSASPDPEADGPTKGQLLGILYFVIALGFAIYESKWGPLHYRSVAYNVGRSLVWPTIVFPGLGKIVGGILVLAIVVGALASNKSSD